MKKIKKGLQCYKALLVTPPRGAAWAGDKKRPKFV